jgi:hypothetical protein
VPRTPAMLPAQRQQVRELPPHPHENNKSNADDQPSHNTQDVVSSKEDIATTQKFIYDLRKATLSNDILPEKVRYLLCNPIEAELDLEDPDLSWVPAESLNGSTMALVVPS